MRATINHVMGQCRNDRRLLYRSHGAVRTTEIRNILAIEQMQLPLSQTGKSRRRPSTSSLGLPRLCHFLTFACPAEFCLLNPHARSITDSASSHQLQHGCLYSNQTVLDRCRIRFSSRVTSLNRVTTGRSEDIQSPCL